MRGKRRGRKEVEAGRLGRSVYRKEGRGETGEMEGVRERREWLGGRGGEITTFTSVPKLPIHNLPHSLLITLVYTPHDSTTAYTTLWADVGDVFSTAAGHEHTWIRVYLRFPARCSRMMTCERFPSYALRAREGEMKGEREGGR